MARPLRIEFEGAFYHVLNRGVERKEIFRDSADYEAFLGMLETLSARFGFKMHAYCLMPNHYHLYLQTPKPNLSKIMRELNGLYTQTFNRRRKRVGPLFQGRYKAILVDHDSYSLELSRYIHVNPVKAGLAKSPESYPWSSYGQFYKKRKTFAFMDTSFILSQFKDLTLFHQFTLEGYSRPWDPSRACQGGCLLGSDTFIEEMKEKFLPRKKDPSISNLRRLQKPSDISFIKQQIGRMTADPARQKKFLVHYLKTHTPLSLMEIARELEGTKILSQAAISLMNKRFLEEDRLSGFRDSSRIKRLLNVKT